MVREIKRELCEWQKQTIFSCVLTNYMLLNNTFKFGQWSTIDTNKLFICDIIFINRIGSIWRKKNNTGSRINRINQYKCDNRIILRNIVVHFFHQFAHNCTLPEHCRITCIRTDEAGRFAAHKSTRSRSICNITYMCTLYTTPNIRVDGSVAHWAITIIIIRSIIMVIVSPRKSGWRCVGGGGQTSASAAAAAAARVGNSRRSQMRANKAKQNAHCSPAVCRASALDRFKLILNWNAG